ncbi:MULTISPECIES: ChbG/HpnK family deacetylase [Derxia]|uniref:ChbG/HpnK family deacetylase n=1 Tax=Derxia gummosa DSM 723 TaxID=1121388 RepID=A0A8B6X8Z2_9BURK|nr:MULTISPECIES: ChbG/HpnK family deacetylase [Derxia]
MKSLVLCADDFGYTDAACAAIVDLAARGRLSATSVMTDGPALARWLPRLRASGLSLGLHLNFTDALPGALAWSLGDVIARSYTGRLDRRAIAADIARQLDACAAAIGCTPDYIDGHQHVHQLPIVREALLAALAERGWKPALRSTRPAGWRGAKAAVIAGLGAAALGRMARRAGLRMNADFDGVYAFDEREPYRALMRRWLARCGDGGLVMCHPGMAGAPATGAGGMPSAGALSASGTAAALASVADPIAAARLREHAYLASDDFAADLADAGARLVPFGG